MVHLRYTLLQLDLLLFGLGLGLVLQYFVVRPLTDAANGDCDTRQRFMSTNRKTACLRALDDQLDGAECAALVAKGACSTAGGLAACRSSASWAGSSAGPPLEAEADQIKS